MGSRPPTCPGCGDRVIWAITQAGKHQALDPQPNPDGNTLAHRDGTGTWRARSVASAGDGPRHPLEKVHMPHAATCRAPKQQPIPGSRPGRRTPALRYRAARKTPLPPNVIQFRRRAR